MNLSAIVEQAKPRTATVSFEGLFDVDILLTTNEEINDGVEAARNEVVNPVSGRLEKETDEVKMRGFLRSRVVGLPKLTLRLAMTLCCRTLPKDNEKDADKLVSCDTETVDTLLRMVVGFRSWLMGQLTLISQQVAREEIESAKN